MSVTIIKNHRYDSSCVVAIMERLKQTSSTQNIDICMTQEFRLLPENCWVEMSLEQISDVRYTHQNHQYDCSCVCCNAGESFNAKNRPQQCKNINICTTQEFQLLSENCWIEMSIKQLSSVPYICQNHWYYRSCIFCNDGERFNDENWPQQHNILLYIW